MLNIYQRILGVMNELHYIQKGKKEAVIGAQQYRFVSHDQVTAAIHPMLVKYGICVIPSVEELKQDGNKTIVKLAIAFRNVDEPNDAFLTHYYGYGVDTGDKGPGKAISYAFKYAILKTFCLETGDDPDFDQNASYEPAKCLEFEMQLPSDMTERDKVKMNKFLVYSADLMKKHVEEVKQEASKRMPEFLTAFKNWNPKKEQS